MTLLRCLLIFAPLVLGGCMTPMPRHVQPAGLGPVGGELRPEAFFAGRTQGRGTLAIRGRGSRVVRVESVGTAEPGGDFRIDQIISFGPRTTRRTWRMRRTGAQTYAATLTDAAGPVTGRVDGRRVTLRYRLQRRPTIMLEQRLYLQPDGRTVLNLTTARLYGLPIARLTEWITRADSVG